jgi:Domain of unknown function (DUF5671)
MERGKEEILGFVREALGRGIARSDIEQALAEAGWQPELIRDALGNFADVKFPVPVPRPRPYLSAREVFVYLVLFSALYTAAFSLGSLVFELIDRGFPDPLQSPYFARMSDDRIRWQVSTIIVAFPIFFFTLRAVTRAIALDPTKRSSRPRKWLTYLTLFVAGVSLVGDATALVYNLLGGELTVRFLLKVAAIGIIAGGIFAFFLNDMSKEERT